MRVLQPSCEIEEEGLALFLAWEAEYPDDTADGFIPWDEYLRKHASKKAKEYIMSIQ